MGFGTWVDPHSSSLLTHSCLIRDSNRRGGLYDNCFCFSEDWESWREKVHLVVYQKNAAVWMEGSCLLMVKFFGSISHCRFGIEQERRSLEFHGSSQKTFHPCGSLN